MGRPKLTTEETASFRADILKAAEALFAEHGFEAVSLRSIAKHLGCSPMRPYKYFASKAEIFDAVRCAAHQQFYQKQVNAIADLSDPLQTIRALGQAYAAYASERPDAYRLIFQLDQPASQSPATQQAEQDMFALLVKANQDAVEAGVLRGDPLTLAHMFWATMHGAITLDLAGKLVHGRQRAELLETLIDGAFINARIEGD